MDGRPPRFVFPRTRGACRFHKRDGKPAHPETVCTIHGRHAVLADLLRGGNPPALQRILVLVHMVRPARPDKSGDCCSGRRRGRRVLLRLCRVQRGQGCLPGRNVQGILRRRKGTERFPWPDGGAAAVSPGRPRRPAQELRRAHPCNIQGTPPMEDRNPDARDEGAGRNGPGAEGRVRHLPRRVSSALRLRRAMRRVPGVPWNQSTSRPSRGARAFRVEPRSGGGRGFRSRRVI